VFIDYTFLPVISVVIIYPLRRRKLVAGVQGSQFAFPHAATLLVHYVPVYVQYIFFVSNTAFLHHMSKSGTPKCKLSEKSEIATKSVL